MAVDSAGDLFIADWYNSVVREVVKATGDIVTIAGNGTAGYSGDGGPATAAELAVPEAVAVDAAGNVFISDTFNNVVREVVKATGDIVTVAGNGIYGYSETVARRPPRNSPALAGWPSTPRATCTSPTWTTASSVRWSSPPATSSPSPATADRVTRATAARPPQPRSVSRRTCSSTRPATSTSATLNNSVIREVVKSTGLITTVAGNGTAGYSGDGGPATIAQLDGPAGHRDGLRGRPVHLRTGNDVIREVVKATGDIITVAGTPGVSGFGGDGGPATSAVFDSNFGPGGRLAGRPVHRRRV